MAEGVATADGAVIESGVFDDPDNEPAPDPDRAPRGWRWDRHERRWVARKSPGRKRSPQRPGPDTGEAGPGQPEGAGEAGGFRDPDPGWMTGPPGPGAFTITAEMRRDIRATLALFYAIPADFLYTADPYCFGALNSNLTPVINATTDLVCASPRVARFAASSAGLMLWVKFAAAARPVLVAAWHHHVLRDVALEPAPPGAEAAGDGQPDYSAYTAVPEAA